jgi:hypothetical protein
VTNIVGAADGELRVDMPVVASYDDVAEDATIIRFTPG